MAGAPRGLQDEHDLRFPLIHGSAEAVPVADATFDLAISEYGAAIWCDPYSWIPEAARVLRPGGRLIFLGNGPLLVLTMTDDPSWNGETRRVGAEMLRDHLSDDLPSYAYLVAGFCIQN